ncbi:MAG: TrmB family transcriptional regulator [Spirochaetales bacterium]|nr:TrmB family transcriptional regulator [Spirochaetales bacterium]
MHKETLTDKLMEIGLSENESRAYLSLLELNPSTGYEIAKQSGIPSSKVYEVLRKLIQRGMVLELKEKGKTRYIPQESRDFIVGYKHKVSGILEDLEDALSNFGNATNASYIWTYDSFGECIEKVKTMILAASRTVLLSIWQEDFPLVKDACDAVESSCKTATVFFGEDEANLPVDGAMRFYHPIRNTIYSEKGGRGLVAVIDSKEAFMGTFFNEAEGFIRAEGTFSKNPGFVALAEDYIKHDIYIMKIVQRFGKELIETYGEGYEQLRDVFSNNTNT